MKNNGGNITGSFKVGNTLNTIVRLADLFHNPLDAFNQILQNAEDNDATEVKIVTFPFSKSVVVMYDGAPITEDELDQISSNVANSRSAGKDDKIGQFGTGFISFRRYAEKLTMISFSEVGREIVWNIYPDYDNGELQYKGAFLQESERLLETKYPAIREFHKLVKRTKKSGENRGVYILLTDFHDNLFNEEFKDAGILAAYISKQWVASFQNPNATVKEIYCADYNSTAKKKYPWKKCSKREKFLGKGDKRLRKTLNGYYEGTTVEVQFDLVVRKALGDYAVTTYVKSQRVSDIREVKGIPKTSAFYDLQVDGTISIKDDKGLLLSDRHKLNTHSPEGKALLNAISQLEDQLSKLVKKVTDQKLDTNLKRQLDRLQKWVRGLMQASNLNFKSQRTLVVDRNPTNNNGNGKKKSRWGTIDELKEKLDQSGYIDPEAKKERKKRRGIGVKIELGAFREADNQKRFMFDGEVLKINTGHVGYTLVKASAKKRKDNRAESDYFRTCVLGAFALKNSERDNRTSVPEDIVEDIIRLLENSLTMEK